MRTISANDNALLTARGGAIKRYRVRVKDSGGTFRDLTTYPGLNFVVGVSWNESVDSNGHDCSITLRRNHEQLNLSPFVTGSALNKAFAFPGSYAPLIDIGREVEVDWSISATETPTWVVGFHGYIDGLNPATGDGTIKLTVRGQYARELDAFIERERAYAFALPSDPDATKGLRVYAPGDTYAVGELVLPSESKLNGHFYKVTSITTGVAGSEGAWPLSGAITFGGVTFTESGITTTSTGTAVETVMQQLLNDNMSSPPTLTTPVSPSWLIRYYKQSRTGVFLALRALADQIGWDVRYKYNSGTGNYRLEFNNIDRTKTTPDREFRADERYRLNRLEVKLEGIRNVVRVVFRDSQDPDASGIPKRKVVEVSDSASITKYGRRFMEVAEGKTTNIDSTTEATAFANAMLSDLKEPLAELEVDMPFFPFVELGDLYRFKADGVHFDSDQDLAVIAYTHNLTSGERPRAVTTLTCRGKPSGGYERWLSADAGRNTQNFSLSKLTSWAANSNVTTRVPGGAAISVTNQKHKTAGPTALEFHLSKSPSFTPSSGTLRQQGFGQQFSPSNLDPGDTYYLQTIPWHYESNGMVARGQPAQELSFVPGYVEPRHLNPATVAQPLPPNGSFEGFTREEGDAVPPDHWDMLNGTWNTDVVKGPQKSGANARDGASYLAFLATSTDTEVECRQFPVTGGIVYELSCWVYNIDGEASETVQLIVEEFSATMSLLATQTMTIDLGDLAFTTWGRFSQLIEMGDTTANAKLIVKKGDVTLYAFHVDAVKLERVGEPIAAVTYADANWGDYGGGFTGVGYWRDSFGLIHLRGLAQTTVARAVAAQICTLPVGFRPATQELFAVCGTPGHVRIDVAASGIVYLQTALGINDFVSLSGIVFDPR